MDIFKRETQEYLLKAGKPVLLVGKHGVGKTTVLRSIAKNFGLVPHELNASTLDPFVHIVGIPVVHEGKVHMNPPDALQAAEILFIDEINRSDRPTRNALMELICDHSVNGKKLENLKLIVAAMNPADDDYQVDALDKALDDRFLHKFDVKSNIDYALDQLPDTKLQHAVRKWYNALNEPPSPRRLTWVIETAFSEEGINEEALLNALDDKLYGTRSLLKMLTKEDHGPDTKREDIVLTENEKLLTAKILASAFKNHHEDLDAATLSEIEDRYGDAEWMLLPTEEMSIEVASKTYEESEYIKELEKLLPFDTRVELNFVGSWTKDWIMKNIINIRSAR